MPKPPTQNDPVEEIAISKFKATCLAVMERVRRTGRPVRVTRFGKPVADILPPAPAQPVRRRLGAMEGELGEYGDIIDTSDLWSDRKTLERWDELEAAADAKRPGRRTGHKRA